MVLEILAYAYTNQASLESLLSTQGVLNNVNDSQEVDLAHANASDPNRILGAISDATDLIDLYCQNYYNPSDLSKSEWVFRRCTWIAAHFLTERRGNPGYFLEQYTKSVEWLEKIQSGLFQIPRIPMSSDLRPALSNYVVDDRFPIAKIRVETFISNGGTYANQQQAPFAFWPDVF